jgi:DNA-binding beta-propeller fold protein YncE
LNINKKKGVKMKKDRMGFCRMFLLMLLVTSVQLGYAQNKSSLDRVAVIALEGPKGQLNHMAYSDTDKHLFIANKGNGSLDVVDVDANQFLQQLPNNKGCSGIDYAPDLGLVMIASGGEKACNIYEKKGDQYQLLKKIEMDGCGKVRYNPVNQRIYIQGKMDDKRVLSVWDANSLTQITNIEIPGKYSVMRVDKKRSKIFINGYDAIHKIDLEKNVLEATWPVEKSRAFKPMAFDEENNRVFMGTRKPAQVVVYDGETGKEIASVDIKGGTDDVLFDPKRKRIYASCGEGYISVVQQVDADNYKLVENIPTVEKARVGVFSPAMDRFYLGVVQTGEMKNQELWVYQPR